MAPASARMDSLASDLMRDAQLSRSLLSRPSAPLKLEKSKKRRRSADLNRLQALDGERIHPQPGMDGDSPDFLDALLAGSRDSRSRHAPLGLTPPAPASRRVLAQAKRDVVASEAASNERVNTRFDLFGSQPAEDRKPSVFSAYQSDVWTVAPEIVQRSEAMARELLSDHSEYALKPPDVEAFMARVKHVYSLVHWGIPPGTRKADRNAMRYHEYWCHLHATPAERPYSAFEENPFREAFREASTMLMALQIMKPRSKQDKEARPSSGANIIYGIRRVLSYGGAKLPSFSLTRQVLKGMFQAYMFIHGKDSMKPRRKEGMPDWVRNAMFEVKDGTKLSSFTVRRGEHTYNTILDAISVLEDTGLRRKGEIVRQPDDLYIKCMTWADVGWRQGANLFESLPDHILTGVLSQFSLLVTPTNSKCDATNEHWGNKPIPIPWENVPHNAVVRIAARWVRLGIGRLTRRQRQKLPLFANSKGEAYDPSSFDRYHNDLLKHVAPTLSSVLSWHSYRIRLASRLRKAGAGDARIQAYCRWQNPESLHIYARWDFDVYEKWLKRSRRVTLDSREAVNLAPTIDGASHIRAARHALGDDDGEGEARSREAPSPSLRFPKGLAGARDSNVIAKKRSKKSKGANGNSRACDRLKPPSLSASPPDASCPYGRSCQVVYNGALPDGCDAVRRHAPKRCYWNFKFAHLPQTLKSAQKAWLAHAATPLLDEPAVISAARPSVPKRKRVACAWWRVNTHQDIRRFAAKRKSRPAAQSTRERHVRTSPSALDAPTPGDRVVPPETTPDALFDSLVHVAPPEAPVDALIDSTDDWLCGFCWRSSPSQWSWCANSDCSRLRLHCEAPTGRKRQRIRVNYGI